MNTFLSNIKGILFLKLSLWKLLTHVFLMTVKANIHIGGKREGKERIIFS